MLTDEQIESIDQMAVPRHDGNIVLDEEELVTVDGTVKT